MPAHRNTKVLIAGGSVAGLTLANTLEQLGIDYLVLEKYGKIAPDVGASIGIFPNGFRILDQLGCYNDIKALVKGADAFQTLATRNEHGQIISEIKDASMHFNKRLGYEPIFVDRQMIIQILYDKLRDKSKVFTGKGVVKVEQTTGGVEVLTQDGEFILGDILVGADGIHSRVRREMWRLADQDSPGYFPTSDRSDVPTEYCCIFGISKPTDRFPKYSSQNVQGRNHSYLIATGPNHRIYWFLFKKLPQAVHGLYEQIPRYTDKQRDALAAEHAEDRLTEALTFGDLYAIRTIATLQALPEVVFQKWHYKRTITIGDAAHKFNPIGGQGGNSAIEDAAVLANQLCKLFVSEDETYNFSDANIIQAFQTTQRIRLGRATNFLKHSHQMQSLQAMDTISSRFVAKHILPRSSPETVLDMICGGAVGAARIEALPLPVRPHCDLWDDERPSKPFDSSVGRYVAPVVLSALAYLAWAKTPHSTAPPSTAVLDIEATTQSTSIPLLDAVLSMSAPSLVDSIGCVNTEHPIQFLHHLSFLTPILAIWYIEGHRHGNQRSPISLPTLFALAAKPLGIGITAPLSFLLSIWSTTSNSHTTTASRRVPNATARALTPAIALGYVAPAISLLVPGLPKAATQAVILWWQMAGLSISGLLNFLSRSTSGFRRRSTIALSPDADVYAKTDLPHLVRLYQSSFFFSLLLHLLSVAVVFVPHDFFLSFAGPDSYSAGGTHGFTSLQWHVLFAALSGVSYGIYTIYELRRRGLITSKRAVWGVVGFISAQGVVGPGSGLVGLWWWREEVLSCCTCVGGNGKTS
ncbi:hypothetical protein M3J07_012766 [Ascochyta lentis]